MPYVKGKGYVHLPPEELARIRSEVARRNAQKNKERHAQEGNTKHKHINSATALWVATDVRDALLKCAKHDGLTIGHFMRRVLDALRELPRYAPLFEDKQEDGRP